MNGVRLPRRSANGIYDWQEVDLWARFAIASWRTVRGARLVTRFRFQFRRYRLPFKTAVRTAHRLWAEREGLIVRLDDASDGAQPAAGFGEAAPIPWFGTETVDDAEEGARAIGEWIEEGALEAVPVRLVCLRNAIASARRALETARAVKPPDPPGTK